MNEKIIARINKLMALGSESFNAGKALGSELSLNRQFGLKAISYQQ